MATPQLPLDEQILSGFTMPDPYGFQDYCQSLLPANSSNDDIYEFLELFKVPKEAYPEVSKQLDLCWKVETFKRIIHVHLGRQVFVSTPNPMHCMSSLGIQPDAADPAFGKSYFSFFASYEYEIGPVVYCIPPGTRDTGHRGYNHVSAELAWGEAKILPGMASKEFVLHWSSNFKLEMVNSGRDINPCQGYPPVLRTFVWQCWPDIAREATTMWDTNWDTNWELPDVHMDVLHTMDLGVAASLDAIQEHAEQELPEPEPEQSKGSMMAWTSSLPHVAASLDTIQEHAEQEPPEQAPLPDQEQAPEQEQFPDLEEIYEADWDYTPASMPDFVDICNDQHQSAHDEIDAESWEWVIAARAPPCKRTRGPVLFTEMEDVD